MEILHHSGAAITALHLDNARPLEGEEKSNPHQRANGEGNPHRERDHFGAPGKVAGSTMCGKMIG